MPAPLPQLPAVADAALSPTLAAAIENHRKAFAAMRAACGPEDLPQDVCDADREAALALAKTPATSANDLRAKLLHLIAYEKMVLGHDPGEEDDFGLIAVAVDVELSATDGACFPKKLGA